VVPHSTAAASTSAAPRRSLLTPVARLYRARPGRHAGGAAAGPPAGTVVATPEASHPTRAEPGRNDLWWLFVMKRGEVPLTAL
jgi:hypothetical protein